MNATKQEHTALPWKSDNRTANNCPGLLPDGRDWQKYIENLKGEAIARVHGATQEETDANAAFIVRACNNFRRLLETLKIISNNYDFNKYCSSQIKTRVKEMIKQAEQEGK